MKDANDKQEAKATVYKQITRGIQKKEKNIQHKKMAKNEGCKAYGTTSVSRLSTRRKNSTCKSDTSPSDIHARG